MMLSTVPQLLLKSRVDNLENGLGVVTDENIL